MTDTIEALTTQEKKLPKWAQAELKSLRERVRMVEGANATLQKQVAEYEARTAGEGEPVIELEPYRGGTERSLGRSQLFPFQSLVRIYTGQGEGDYIGVALTDDGVVEISSGHIGGLLVIPGASNIIRVQTEVSFIATKAARLKAWENRVAEAQCKLEEAKKRAHRNGVFIR